MWLESCCAEGRRVVSRDEIWGTVRQMAEIIYLHELERKTEPKEEPSSHRHYQSKDEEGKKGRVKSMSSVEEKSEKTDIYHRATLSSCRVNGQRDIR